MVICNLPWSKAISIAQECCNNSVPVILVFTGGLYLNIYSIRNMSVDKERYFFFASDLGEYEYLDVKQYKQSEIPLLGIRELGGMYLRFCNVSTEVLQEAQKAIRTK